jgi:carboxypeptidase C (cathepsin A)
MTNSNNSMDKTIEDFRVVGLEEVQPAYAEFDGAMYAGLLPSDNGNRTGETMFWLFEPETQNIPDTIVLWLNGGPGCSSFNCGVMMENSPVTQPLHAAGFCCLKPTPELSYNEHAWTRATTMLYVEHPIGTGFSHGDVNPEDEVTASTDLHAFLLNFFEVFDHLKSSKFYVMGESYAGMFIPSITRYIHMQNLVRPDHQYIPIKGAAIGNGWMDARVQGKAVIDYSWWHGLIDEPTRDALHIVFENCLQGNAVSPPFHPLSVQDDCGLMWGVLQAAGNPNAYDITTWDPNVDQITFTSEVFYNNPLVKKALNAPMNVTWHGCRQGEGRRRLTEQHRRLYMVNDRPWNVVPYVADILDAGIPVVVYNGDRDMTTNMVGSELLLNKMEWSGQKEWTDAPRGLWMVNGTQAGWAKEYGKLSFVVVYNSGHMVPYNQPKPAFDLVTRLLTGASFLDIESPLIRAQAPLPTKESIGVPTLSMDVLGSSSLGLGGSMMPHAGHSLATVVVSMLVGALITVFFLRRPRQQRTYQAIPDANY